MGSRGRSSPAYRRARAEFASGRFPCWICGLRPGTWVDHVPPLSDFPTPEAWVGRYAPSCPPCQRRQGAQITNRRNQGPGWTL